MRFLTVPDKNPRTECGNQPVASESSVKDTPFDFLSNVRIMIVLVGLALGVAGRALRIVDFAGCLSVFLLFVALVCITVSFGLM